MTQQGYSLHTSLSYLLGSSLGSLLNRLPHSLPTLLILMWSALPISSVAKEIYQCQTQLGLSYSDTPCADDAQVVTIELQNTPIPAATTESLAERQQAITDYVSEQQTNREINQLQQQVDALMAQRQQVIRQRNERLAYTDSNATKASSNLSAQAQQIQVPKALVALHQQANQDISKLDKKIQRLKIQIQKLSAQ